MPHKKLSMHHEYEFFKAVCRLYNKSLFATLPFSILAVLLFDIFLRLQHWLPMFQKSSLLPLGMIGAILCLPIIPVIWLIQIAVRQKQPITYRTFFLLAYQRLLGLFGCLISMLLLPMVVLGLLLMGAMGVWYWVSTQANPHTWAWLFEPFGLYGFKIGVGFILMAVINAKLLAPLLIFTDNLDPESALIKSSALIKPQQFRAYLYHLYGFLILVFAYQLPTLILMFLPQLTVAYWVPMLISDLLVGLLLPWTLSLWLMECVLFSKLQKSD